MATSASEISDLSSSKDIAPRSTALKLVVSFVSFKPYLENKKDQVWHPPALKGGDSHFWTTMPAPRPKKHTRSRSPVKKTWITAPGFPRPVLGQPQRVLWCMIRAQGHALVAGIAQRDRLPPVQQVLFGQVRVERPDARAAQAQRLQCRRRMARPAHTAYRMATLLDAKKNPHHPEGDGGVVMQPREQIPKGDARRLIRPLPGLAPSQCRSVSEHHQWPSRTRRVPFAFHRHQRTA